MATNNNTILKFKTQIQNKKDELGVNGVYVGPSIDHIMDINDQLPAVLITDYAEEVQAVSNGAYDLECELSVIVYMSFLNNDDNILKNILNKTNDVQNVIESITDSQIQIYQTTCERASVNGTIISKEIKVNFSLCGVEYANH
jgi:hypothetical protein